MHRHPNRTSRLLGVIAAGSALIPCLVALINLRLLTRIRRGPVESGSGVSVLIPARNEAHHIRSALDAVIANGSVVSEILVLDDNSDDDTCRILENLAEPRLRVITGARLPPGWCGKNYACAQLAAEATQPYLLFLDADVTLAVDAVGRMLSRIQTIDHPAMLSGVPMQITGTMLEWLLLPLIDVLLYGYLPLAVDDGRHPGLAAACGQIIMVRRDAYRASGGHAAIRDRLHDAIALARIFRRHGYRTALVEATDLATCRMYNNAHDVYVGLMKNAVEGMAGPRALPVWTMLLGSAHILPFLLQRNPAVVIARLASICLRLIVAFRCRQGVCTVIFSPLGFALLLVIQFHARLRHLLGHHVSWKGRHYETVTVPRRDNAGHVSPMLRSGIHNRDHHRQRPR